MLHILFIAKSWRIHVFGITMWLLCFVSTLKKACLHERWSRTLGWYEECNFCNYRIHLATCSDVSPQFPESTACSSALKFDGLPNVPLKKINHNIWKIFWSKCIWKGCFSDAVHSVLTPTAKTNKTTMENLYFRFWVNSTEIWFAAAWGKRGDYLPEKSDSWPTLCFQQGECYTENLV